MNQGLQDRNIWCEAPKRLVSKRNTAFLYVVTSWGKCVGYAPPPDGLVRVAETSDIKDAKQ